VLWTVVSLFLVGCASWQPCPYGVTGHIVGVDSAVPAQRTRRVEELESALLPLGFPAQNRFPTLNPDGSYFPSSEDPASVVTASPSQSPWTRCNSVSQDHMNVRETPLARDTITAVQTHLATAFHATIDFKRVTRCYI
jgi:hypothetical protein